MFTCSHISPFTQRVFVVDVCTTSSHAILACGKGLCQIYEQKKPPQSTWEFMIQKIVKNLKVITAYLFSSSKRLQCVLDHQPDTARTQWTCHEGDEAGAFNTTSLLQDYVPVTLNACRGLMAYRQLWTTLSASTRLDPTTTFLRWYNLVR